MLPERFEVNKSMNIPVINVKTLIYMRDQKQTKPMYK